jgi:PAS domain S-box-containing protein
MYKSNEEIEEEDALKNNKKDNLVLGIDSKGKILKFNELCEQVSGYNKDKVLNKNFFDLLIPNRYQNVWENFFNHSKQNKMIHDFKLPFITKNGHEIMISWSSFPIKNKTNDEIHIDFVGSIISSWKDVISPSIIYNEIIPVEDNKQSLFSSSKIEKNDESSKLIKKLKTLNVELEKKNKLLDKKLKNMKTQHAHIIENLEKKIKQSNVIVNKGLYSFSELFGGKKRKEEFENKINELDEREKFLNNLGANLLKEKEKIKNSVNEFREWREKLETLEEDIEKRRLDIMNQERILLSDITGKDEIDVIEPTKEELKQTYDVFEKIEDSAAIIQRGIIKRTNESFENLIGYSSNEIINRSLFDFISPEGFIDMEKYYLNRLKGEDVSNYKTVILSKNNLKIHVEINSNPTFIDGEKAEIVVFKKSGELRHKIKDEIIGNNISQKSRFATKEKVKKDEMEDSFDKNENVKESSDVEKIIDEIKSSERVFKKNNIKDNSKNNINRDLNGEKDDNNLLNKDLKTDLSEEIINKEKEKKEKNNLLD